MRSISKTFRLSSDAVAALDELVRSGRAANQTSLIESLIRTEKARLDMERGEAELDRLWAEAMADPGYREEMLRVHEEFAEADTESARLIR